MRVSLMGPTAARRRSRTGLSYLVTSGLLWGTGGLTLLPLAAAVLAALILGDRLSVTGIAGAAILAAAVIGAVRANR